MSTLYSVPNETLSQTVARRIRGLLGEKRISQAKFAKMLETNTASMSRRLSGEYPIDLAEVEKYAAALGVSPMRLLTGRPDGGSGPDGPDVRPKGFEPLTFWSVVATCPRCGFQGTSPF
ncbi:helix-turn-helix domain-containing protein [Mycobacteroides salmoniphilum]|uniref:helix-turn-helix domain-containing protein n=2 Tax=Mycobacteriaceae TaxID=1762 RepID=UPI00356594A6